MAINSNAFFASGNYFTPDSNRGLINCVASIINISIVGDDTLKVLTISTEEPNIGVIE